MFTIGVEEEFHVVDPVSRALVPDAAGIIAQLPHGGAGIERELHAALIETATPVCHSLGQVREELRRLRGMVIQAAERAGHRVAACGTVPLFELARQRVTPTPRFEQMLDDYQQVAREQLICGCQTHIGFARRELAVQVMNRARPWLPILLALSGSSPFWAGADTGFASYRSQVWVRWPTYGTPGPFASAGEYDDLVKVLIATGGIADEGMVYWDLRPSPRFPTLEVRIADACPTINEVVLQAGLSRALARTCYEEFERGEPVPEVRQELLEVAKWRAARFGLAGTLIDVVGQALVPAETMVRRLLAYVRPALEEHGDWDEIGALVEQTLRRGTSAARQRRAFRRRGALTDVVDLVVAETAAG